MLGEKKCGPVHKPEKIEVESRDACVVGVFIFYSLIRPTSGSLHWEEKNQCRCFKLLFVMGHLYSYATIVHALMVL